MDTQTWSAELEDIFVNQRPRLCCVAARVLGNADQADDVVQDAYLKAHILRVTCGAQPRH